MLDKDKIMEMGKIIAGPAPSPVGAVKKTLKYQKEQSKTGPTPSSDEDIKRALKYQKEVFKDRIAGTNIFDKIKSKLKARELMDKEINSKVSLPNQSTPNDYRRVYEKQEGVKVRDKKEELYKKLLTKIAEDKRSAKTKK